MSERPLRLLHLTPGTGSYHCGGCLRDVALVRALRAAGQDALCVPLYLPLVTEEGEEVSGRIFFGGVNVYLQQKTTLFRHTPDWLDRLWDGPGLLRRLSMHGHMTDPHELGEMTLSMLRGPEGKQAKEVRKLARGLQVHQPVDLICLSNALLIGSAPALRTTLGVPVVCTLQGEDAFADSLPEPWRSRVWEELARKIRQLDGAIAVSDYYGEVMSERLGLPEGFIRCAHNGIVAEAFSPRRVPNPEPPVIGYLARMCSDKGVDRLVDAFILLRKRLGARAVKLHLAGAFTPADETLVAQLKERLESAGLSADVRWSPNISRAEKQRFLSEWTLLSVPALYGECFGLYLLEAWASGIPVVQPRHAAFPELLEKSGGGVLYDPPDSTEALADALQTLLDDPARANALGQAGRQATEGPFAMKQTAARVMEVYRGIISPSR